MIHNYKIVNKLQAYEIFKIKLIRTQRREQHKYIFFLVKNIKYQLIFNSASNESVRRIFVNVRIDKKVLTQW